MPLTTKLTSRLPHFEHTSRLPMPERSSRDRTIRACSGGSGSLRWPQALHHTMNRRCAAAALSRVIGGPGR